MDTKAAFEKHLRDQGIKPVGWLKAEYWEIWQASRAAIEIELESLSDRYFASDIKNSFEHGRATERRKTIDVLTSHGIRIKGKAE